MDLKKIAAALLAAATVLTYNMGYFPSDVNLQRYSLTASAAGETAVLDEATGVLTLKGNVVKEDVQAYAGNSKVTSVVAEAGTVLPEDCISLFCGLDSDSVPVYWRNLALVDLSKADSSKVTDMTSMFDTCLALTSVDLSGFD